MITISNLNGYCGISIEIDEEKVNPIITTQELKKVKYLLGIPLYNLLKSEITSGYYTGLNEQLHDNIKPFLSWAVASSYYSQSNSINTRTGLKTLSDADSNPAIIEEITSMVKDAESNELIYKRELIQFINDNLSDFPLYDDNCLNPNKSTFKITKIKKS
jgi:hypothetical protein